MYVIYSIRKKCYVAAMGFKFGYTRSIFKARRYKTVDAARADSGCDERIERLPSWLF